MHLQGEPIVVVSAWLGHADPAFTTRTYGHSQNDALKTRGDEFAASRVTVVSMRGGNRTCLHPLRNMLPQVGMVF